MTPSSWKHCTFMRRISSSAIVPYGSSMWISQGGSAMITGNLPSTSIGKLRMSQLMNCDS
jgi:hypothetical protein